MSYDPTKIEAAAYREIKDVVQTAQKQAGPLWKSHTNVLNDIAKVIIKYEGMKE